MAVLKKSCIFGLPSVLYVLCLFVIFAVSNFDFKGGTVVLIAPVAGHSFNANNVKNQTTYNVAFIHKPV